MSPAQHGQRCLREFTVKAAFTCSVGASNHIMSTGQTWFKLPRPHFLPAALAALVNCHGNQSLAGAQGRGRWRPVFCLKNSLYTSMVKLKSALLQCCFVVCVGVCIMIIIYWNYYFGRAYSSSLSLESNIALPKLFLEYLR